MTLLSRRWARVIAIAIATFTVTHGTARIGRKGRPQRRGDPRIRAGNRIGRNRGPVNVLGLCVRMAVCMGM